METDQILYDFSRDLRKQPYYLNYFNPIGNIRNYIVGIGTPTAVTRLVLTKNDIVGMKSGITTPIATLGLSPNTDYILRITGYVPNGSTSVYAILLNSQNSSPLGNKVYLQFASSPVETTGTFSVDSLAVNASVNVYFENGLADQCCYIRYIEISSQVLGGFKEWKFVENGNKLDLIHKYNALDHLIEEWTDLDAI